MKSPFIFALFLVLTLSSVLMAKNFTQDEFKKELSDQTDTTGIIALCKQYIEGSSDIEVIEFAARVFNRESETGLDDYIKSKVTSDPSLVTFKFLAGTRLKDPVAMAAAGRDLIKSAPKETAGYIVLGRAYTMGLFASRMSNSKKSPELEVTLAKDIPLFDAMTTLESPRHDLNLYLTLYRIHTKKFDLALKEVESAIAAKEKWADPSLLPLIHAGMGDYTKALGSIESYVQVGIDRGQYKGTDKARLIDSMYNSTLLMVSAYDEAIRFYTTQDGLDANRDALYNLACAYALKGNADKAFEQLTKAANAGYDDSEGLNEDSDLDVLKKDPRWTTALEAVKAAHVKGAEKRKAAVLLSKVTKDAPDWELKTPAGTTVKLSEIKDKIVILDFWATWCGPCMMAMPALDQWCKTKKPANVDVYSINVWEKDPGKAKTLFEQKKFAMTLLIGTEAVAQAYGITGIPYICAIDKTGKIRYEQDGFSREFEETLDFWVEDLSK